MHERGKKPIKVIKKENRAAAKKTKFKADQANAAEIESAQRPDGAAGSVVGCLGEEARSEGRMGRGGGGEGGLGEGGGGRANSRNYLQLLLVPPCLRTPFLSLRLRRALTRLSDRPSTHAPNHAPSCPFLFFSLSHRLQIGASGS